MFGDLRHTLRRAFRDSWLHGILSVGWWRSMVPFWITPTFFGLVISLPFRWFVFAWRERRWRNLLWGLPALTMAIALAVEFHHLRQQAISIGVTYLADARAAIAAKDFPKAELLLNRVLQQGQGNRDDARYGLAVVYEATGHPDRAEVLFSSLAPDSRIGHREAHRRMAVLLSESIKAGSAEPELRRLKWHLDAAADQDLPEVSLAWGRYYVAIQDLNAARGHLEKAAIHFPELWMTLGEVNAGLGRAEQALASYQKANAYFVDQLKLEANENERSNRVSYATVLMRLGRLDEAKVVLEEGLQSDPEGEWHKLLAGLYVNYHDILSTQGGHSISVLLKPISEALDHEPNFQPALNRLMAYVNANVNGNIELRKILSRVVAEGKEPALAHLALGNLCWIENDTDAAVFHFEQAMAINKKLALVMNNLAWLLAHDEKGPDFERALGLINSAIQEYPENASFLDTRGTVYMKMGRLKEALTDFQVSLKGVTDPAAVHAKLAQVYEQLGRSEMAEQHRALEQESRNAAQAKASAPAVAR